MYFSLTSSYNWVCISFSAFIMKSLTYYSFNTFQVSHSLVCWDITIIAKYKSSDEWTFRILPNFYQK